MVKRTKKMLRIFLKPLIIGLSPDFLLTVLKIAPIINNDGKSERSNIPNKKKGVPLSKVEARNSPTPNAFREKFFNQTVDSKIIKIEGTTRTYSSIGSKLNIFFINLLCVYSKNI